MATPKINRERLEELASEVLRAELREVLNTEEAAKLLGVSRQYLEIGRVQGYGPPYSKLGRLVRYKRSTLLDWLDAQRVTP